MDTKNVAFRLLSRPFASFDVFPFPLSQLAAGGRTGQPNALKRAG